MGTIRMRTHNESGCIVVTTEETDISLDSMPPIDHATTILFGHDYEFSETAHKMAVDWARLIDKAMPLYRRGYISQDRRDALLAELKVEIDETLNKLERENETP